MSLRPRVRTDRPRRQTVPERVAALPARAARLLGEDWAAATRPVPGQMPARTVLDAVLAHLDAATDPVDAARLDALAALAADALELDDVVRRENEARRRALAVAVDESLSRLRRYGTSAELVDAACREASKACGLERVLLSRIVGDSWYPWMAWFTDDQEHRDELLHAASDGVALTLLPQEQEVLDSRHPLTVADAADSHLPLAALADSASYVVVPLTPAGRVVGFMHADHGVDGPPVTDEDRDILWMFAEAFGRIYERAVLLERMARQRAHVRETFEVVETFMSTVATSDIELVRHDDPGTSGDPEPEVGDAATAIDQLLTEREREVMAMMLHGYTNQVIAERLVIKEGTVKSHVKHILRKVGAANRTEAISRYAGAVRN